MARTAVREGAPTAAPGAERDLGFVSQTRSAAEFERAQRHSRRVKFLKLALPLGGAAAIVLMIVAFVVTQFALPKVQIETARIEDGKLVMANPRLAGSDNNDRPYSLTAERAIQDAAQPTRITLEQISATLPVDGTNAAAITAGLGVYDADAKTLTLSGKVAVDMKDGTTIRLEDASIDIEKGRLTTDSPVAIDAGRAKVTADSLVVEDRGKSIVFERRVRMTLMPIGTGVDN